MTEENPDSNNQNVNLISQNENDKDTPVKSEASFNLVKKKDSTQKPEMAKPNSNSKFSIEVSTLEKLMGYYKERGSDFQDLKFFEENGGSDYIIKELKTDIHNGVDDLNNREEEFGSNKVFVEPVPPFCSYVLEALEDMMLRILIVSAIVSIVLGCTLSDDPRMTGLMVYLSLLLLSSSP